MEYVVARNESSKMNITRYYHVLMGIIKWKYYILLFVRILNVLQQVILQETLIQFHVHIYIYKIVNVSHLIDKDYNNVESERFVKDKKKSRKLVDNYKQNC